MKRLFSGMPRKSTGPWRASDRLKLMIHTAGISGLVVVLTFLVFAAYWTWMGRAWREEEITNFAKLIAERESAALVFWDRTLAHKTLYALAPLPYLQKACLYDAGGRLYASYLREPGVESCLATFEKDSEESKVFEVVEKVPFGRISVGVLALEIEQRAFLSRILMSLNPVGGVLIAAVLLSAWVGSRIYRRSMKPLDGLAQVIERITAEGNYDLRVQETDGQSSGKLIPAFNAMLDQIQARDRELVLAKESAELANQSKSQFLANMNHELRTPLNAIIGFSDLIKSETMGPIGNAFYKTYIADIHNSGAHLLDVINDILDYSKLESGKHELRIEQVDASRLIEKTIRMVYPRAEEAGVQIHVQLAEKPMLIWTDERKLRQVMLNLTSNAIKFTKTGGSVTVSGAFNYTRRRFTMACQDTGIGIAPENIEKALAPFGQVDNRLGREYEGTGLGLPLVKKFVELLGGTFTLYSEVNVGTTCVVDLPVGQRPGGERATPEGKDS